MSTLTPERWRRVKAVLAGALEAPPDARAAYVDRACGSDPALRDEVMSLLSADDARGGLLASGPVGDGSRPGLGSTDGAEHGADDGAALRATLQAALAGRYAVEREIGRGGMASVYLAHDLKHDRLVALKVLRPDLGAVLGAERFLREIGITANLQHPNILPLFDSGQAGGLLYYVMLFVDGESLRARLARERQLPVDEAVRIAVAVAHALDYAHAHGVIHRDLKPENILLQAGEPVVADFGIALAVTRSAGERLTGTGMSLGTPQYMAPEQATGDRTPDARSDVYALAAVLYEMLVGDPPHTGSTVQAIVARVLTEDVRPVRALRPSVPEHVAAAVARGLEKLPADRWPSAQAFAEALAGERRVVVGSPLGNRRRTAGSRRRVLPIAVACTVAGAAVGAAALSWSRLGERTGPVWFDLALPDSLAPPREESSDGIPSGIDLSPDGAVIAFVGGASRSLFVRPLDESAPRRLDGTEGASCPSFSPDGRWLLFAAGAQLSKVPVGGGAPIVVADTAGCGVWTDRDEILFESEARNLYLVPATGGPKTLVSRSDLAKGIGALVPAQALPGGRAALIVVSRNGMFEFQIGLVTLPDGRITKLTPWTGLPRHWPRYAQGHLLSLSGGKLVAAPFSLRTMRFTGPDVTLLENVAGRFGTAKSGSLAYLSRGPDRFSLVAVAADGTTHGAMRTLGGGTSASGAPLSPPPLDTAHLSWPRLSPDGKRIALELRARDWSWDVWIYDIATRTLSRLTSGFTGIRPAGWTADGREVLYAALDSSLDSGGLSGPRRLVAQGWDGGPRSELMKLPPWAGGAPPRALVGARLGGVSHVSVGPPHGYVAFTTAVFSHSGRRAEWNSDIWMAPLDTPTAARPLVATAAAEHRPSLSPDGKWLAYVSDETGRPEVYVRPLFGSARRVQVSAGGATDPVWAPDGRQLHYRDSPRGYVMRARIAAEATPRVVRRDSLFRDVFTFEGGTNFDVFPDGKELLMIRGRLSPLHVSVVLDWPALLRQRASRR